MAKVHAGLLCDFAQVREGLLFIASGGVTRGARLSVPADMGVMLALVIELQPHEQAEAHEIVIVVKQNETATDVARAVAGLQVDPTEAYPGETLLVPVVVDLRTVPVPVYGSYDVRMIVDGNDGPSLTFYVVPVPGTPGT